MTATYEAPFAGGLDAMPEGDIRERLIHDCGAFAEVVLGHDHWEVAEEIMAAISVPGARVAVKSCNASSKTFTAADAVLWAASGGNMAITTAPTSTQVEHIMWPEIRAAYDGSKQPLGGRCLVEALEIGSGNAFGISTDQANRLQGFHSKPGKFLLFVVDEGPGLRPELWNAIEGNAAAGDVRILVLGNPTVASGPFFEMFGASSYKHFTIDAFHTPNLEGLSLEDLLALPEHELDQNVRPYLVTRRWVRDRYLEWGEKNPEWQSRVRGQFPDQSDDALIPRSKIAEAHVRAIMVYPDTPFDAGLDVAGPGDDETVLWIRQGPRLVSMHAWQEANTERLLGNIGEVLGRYGDKLETLSADSTGIGWHLAGSIQMLHKQLVVIPVNAGGRTSDPKRFVNLKAELFWLLRHFFLQDLVGGHLDEVTQAQLSSLRWGLNYVGQIEIERKSSLRARGVPSPDRAEALMLAFASVLLHRRKQGANFGGARSKRVRQAQFIKMGGR